MSSNDDFDGPTFRSAGPRGADENSGGAYGGGGTYGGGGQGAAGPQAGAGRYPEPEGWGKDGFWRDSAIDSDYETGLTNAVRAAKDGPRDDPGYSYFADGKGWQNSPGKSARAGDATSLDAPRAAFAAGAFGVPGDPTRMDYPGRPGGDPTAVYRGGPGGPGGPYGPGRGGPGGRGPGRRGAGGPVSKRKGNWWRHWTWKKALAVAGGVFVFFFLCLFGGYEYLYSTTSIPAAVTADMQQDNVVYYSNGTTEIGTIGDTNRQDLTLGEIPKNLQNAFIAAEDKNFWTEGAISPTGILRAAIHDVLGGGGSLNGGSTITQEFVRNYYGLGLQQTMSRKIKEIIISEKVAKSESKQWILQNYLNTIFLGENSYGVEAAANTYFGVPVSKLTISEDAVLASMPQAPSLLPQESDKSGLEYRWNYVLDQMVKDGLITQAQKNAQKFPTLLTWSDPSRGEMESNINPADNHPWDPYILTAVEDELTQVDGVSQQTLDQGGLKIVTNISLSMEKEMYNAVKTTLSPANIQAAPGSTVSSLPSWTHIGAELQDPQTGAILAIYPGPGQNMSAKQCAAEDCDDDTALYTREQVGSSFKPYVLSTAVQQGMDVEDSIMNTSPYMCVPPDSEPSTYAQPITAAQYATPPITSADCPSLYLKLENDDGEIIGHSVGTIGTGSYAGAGVYADSVQDALAQSSNTGYTDLAHVTGTANIIKMAAAYGVNTQPYPQGSGLSQMVGDVGMALGTASLTVNEQTTMLSTIDDGGLYHAAHIIKYWQDQPDGVKNMPVVASHQVLSEAQDSQVEYAMDMTTVDGTAAGSVTLNRPIISKTGTTSSEHDGFFIGAIPQYSLAVGMFTDSDSSHNLVELGGGGDGGFWSAKVWNTFAMDEFNNLPVEQLPAPQFSGSKWNLVGPFTKKTAKKTNCLNLNLGGGHGRKFPGLTIPGCPATPSAAPTATLPGGFPSVAPSSTQTTVSGQPTSTLTATPTPTPTATVSNPAVPVQGGLAVGGVLAVLPGSLLWTTASRRRKRRRPAGR